MNLVSDEMADGCAVLDNASAILFKTESGAMKRIRLSDLKTFNRPAKGELIAKKVKSNPQRIETIRSVSSTEGLMVTHLRKNWISSKDVPLMDKEATFSQPVALKTFDLVKGIEEIRIVDFVERLESVDEAAEPHPDVEFIHFDLPE